jgi:hypothetical protein
MKNISLRMKALSGVLCAGLAFSGTNISFAAVNEIGNAEVKLVTSMEPRVPMDEKKVKEAPQAKMKVVLEVVIKESVESNVITKAEGDKVLKYLAEKSENKCGDRKKCKKARGDHAKGGLFKDLVTDGVLTQAKSDALREGMYIKKAELRTQELQKGLTTLVANKVLTIEQRNKVEEAIMAKNAQRKEAYRKMRDMNEKEREDYMKEIKSSGVNPMKVLVDNGTITKDQEKEVQKILPHYNKGGRGHK